MGLIDTLKTSGELVLFLDFRSGNLYDYSGNNAAVTPTNQVWNSRNGLSFANSTSKVVVTDKASLRLTQGTIIALGSFKTVSNSPHIADKSSAGGTNFRFYYDSSNIYVQSGATIRAVVYPLTQGKRCLACNFKDGETIEVFGDGVSLGTSGLTLTVASTTDDLTIGNAYNSSNVLKNNLAAVCIINRKLTATEHAQIFGELQAMKWPTKAITRAKPIKNIGISNDSTLLGSFEVSRKGNTTYDNGTVLNNASTVGTPWFRNSRTGKNAEFGTGSTTKIVNTVNNAYQFEYPVTLSCWYRPTTTATLAQVWGRPYSDWRLVADTDARADFRVNSNNLTLNWAAADLLRAGVWVHLAAVYDGANAYVYYNGQLSATTPYNTAWAETNQSLSIGNDPFSGGSVPGSIADCKCWQRALTQPEILQEYQRGARQNFSLGPAKQLSLSTTNRVLQGLWNNRTTTGTIGTEAIGGRVITYAQANAGSILALFAFPTSSRSNATPFGFSSPGQWHASEQTWGTWQWTTYKASDTSTVRLMPFANGQNEWNSGGINGYLVEIDANEAIGLYRITTSAKASTIMLSTNGYITRNAWHKIKLTRNVNGEFALYVDDVLVPASGGGTNPGSDTTYLSGFLVSSVSLSDGDRFALSCNTGECSYVRALGVI